MDNQQSSYGQPIPPAGGQAAGARKLPGTFDLINQAIDVYFKNWQPIVILMVIMALVAIGLVFLAGVLSGLFVTAAGAAGAILAFVVVAIAVIAAIVISIWMSAAILIVVKDRGTKPGWKGALASAKPLIGRFFWTGLLSCIIIMVGYILLIIPGLIFTVWFMWASYLVVYEGISGTAAVSRSKDLARGYFWPIFGRVILLVIFTAVISGILNIIPLLGGLVSSLIIQPIAMIFAIILFENLRSIKGAR